MKEFPAAPTALASAKKRKQNRLPYTDAAIKHTVKALTSDLTFLCPVTGLTVPVSLPPFPGVVFEAYHPIAHNGLAMLELHTSYLESLPKPALCATFLAAMHQLKKIELNCSALLVNTAMQSALTNKQLIKALGFISDAILRTRKGYPPIRLGADLSEDTFNDYFNACVTLENYSPEPMEVASSIKAPSFLSSTNQAKQLDKTCYEAWLEVASYLPKITVSKAAPYIKTLASTPVDSTIKRLVSAVLTYTCADEYFQTNSGHLVSEDSSLTKTLESNLEYAAALAAYEFRNIVANKRAEAQALGLHRDIFDIELGLTNEYEPTPAPAQVMEAVEPTAVEPVAEKKPMTFSERMKAKAAAKAGGLQ